jgi:adenine-specific DNA-methyltransferase
MTNPSLNTLYHGDCIPLMQTISDNCIDLILTDPPYLVNYRDRTGRTIAGDINGDWLTPAFTEMYRVLRPNRFAICFYGWNHADTFVTAFKKAGFRIVGHFVFAKHYASRRGFTEARHECAYLLAKGASQSIIRCHGMGCLHGQQAASDTKARRNPACADQMLQRHWRCGA